MIDVHSTNVGILDTNKFPENLQEAVMPVLAMKTCEAMPNFSSLMQICAGYEEGGIDSCQVNYRSFIISLKR